MSGLKVSFGLNAAAASKGKGKPSLPTARKPSAFSALNNSDDDDEPPPHASSSSSTNPKTKKVAQERSFNLLLQKAKQEEAKRLDETVFEYDEVWDDMKAAEQSAKMAKVQEGAERKPQYVSGLMATAKQRQLDRTRAEDKLVHRERLAEGDEFADKDSFVTPAYLAQQEEHRKAEEEEKAKADKGPEAGGMATFYQSMLAKEEERHAAAVKAAAGAKRSTNSLSATLASAAANPAPPPPQYDPEPDAAPSEANVAAEASVRTGAKVDLDDEGKIIDHRQLLTGGLNTGLSKRKSSSTASRGFAIPIAQRAAEDRAKAAEVAAKLKEESERVGMMGCLKGERLRLSRERQSRMLQEQLLALEDRKRKAEEEKVEEGVKRLKKRNDESRVEELKRKAAERRRAREEMMQSAPV